MSAAQEKQGTEGTLAGCAKKGLYHVGFAMFRKDVGLVSEGDFVLEADIPWDLQSALALKATCKREAHVTSKLDASHDVQLRSITRLDGLGAYSG